MIPDPREMKPDPREMKPDPREMKADPREMKTDPREMKTDPREMTTDPREMRTDSHEAMSDAREMKTAPPGTERSRVLRHSFPTHLLERRQDICRSPGVTRLLIPTFFAAARTARWTES